MNLFRTLHQDRHIQETALSLSDIKQGSRAVVAGILGGKGLSARLAALGVTTGVEIEIVQNFSRGPMIIYVRGTRVALGRGEARKVLVEAQ